MFSATAVEEEEEEVKEKTKKLFRSKSVIGEAK